jgi:hypothetical protein
MNAEPCASGESKRDLLPSRLRAQQLRAAERLLDQMRIAATEDALRSVQVEAQDALADAIIPAPAEILDFSELRHVLKLSALANCSGRTPLGAASSSNGCSTYRSLASTHRRS